MNDILDCYRRFMDFNGRATRRVYWSFALFEFLALIVIAVLSNFAQLDDETNAAALGIWMLLNLLPGLAVTVRRLHDTDRSGWWSLLPLIPAIGNVWLMVLLVLKGTAGSNRFGAGSLIPASAAPLWSPAPEPAREPPPWIRPEPVEVRLPDAFEPIGSDAATQADLPRANRQGEERTRLAGPADYAPPSGVPAREGDDPVVGWVVVVDGPGKGRWRQLGYGANDIARSPEARVPLDFGDELLSRERHAVITFDPRSLGFYLQHGGGRNLTYLDDAPVLMPQELRSGQEIMLGGSRLRFIALCGPDFNWGSS